MTIKAIETVYKGYKFRSRLEARWAVFFDALRIEWQYEVEGFDLDGIWYLPDFWLPKFEDGLWIEVKPNLNISNDEFGKIARIAALKRDRILLLHNEFGLFANGNGVLFLPDKPPCGHWEFEGDNLPKHYATLAWFGQWHGPGVKNHNPHLLKGNDQIDTESEMWKLLIKAELLSPPIQEAYTAARQARFEHGQSGT